MSSYPSCPQSSSARIATSQCTTSSSATVAQATRQLCRQHGCGSVDARSRHPHNPTRVVSPPLMHTSATWPYSARTRVPNGTVHSPSVRKSNISTNCLVSGTDCIRSPTRLGRLSATVQWLVCSGTLDTTRLTTLSSTGSETCGDTE